MGKVRMPLNLKYFGLSGITGMDVKLLASTLLQLPEGTKLVGLEMGDGINTGEALVFSHPLFKDGAELIGSYNRDVAVVEDKVETVDHFIGLDLESALVREGE